MSLEAASYVPDLVSTNPQDSDALSQGAAHLRYLKTALLNGLKKVALSGSAIDLKTGAWFTKTVSSNLTWTVSNIPAATYIYPYVLELTNAGGYTQSWPSGWTFDAGQLPTLTTSGTDTLLIVPYPGGATSRVFVCGKAMA